MNKIVFVRYRSFYPGVPPMIDVLYKSGKMISIGEEEMPKTVKDFLQSAHGRYEHSKMHGHTFIYYA